MPSFNHPNSNTNGDSWSGITKILSTQLAILIALAVATIVYLNWSSKAAVTEFNATGNPSASEPGRLPQSSVPLQQVKSRTVCPRRA